MAFVFKSKREPSHIKNNISEQIGPGSYVAHVDYKIPKLAQPFNSSEPRQKEKEAKNLSPGPGHYQITKSNINEKVVVSSANEDIKIVEVPKPQSIFKSVTKRFEAPKVVETPGPGAYIAQDTMNAIANLKVSNKQKQNIIDHLMKINRYQSIPSIPSNVHAFGYTENEQNDLELNKLPQHIHTGIKSDIVGPGQYNLKDMFDKNRARGASWSKYNSQRLMEAKNETPGAGQYDVSSQFIPQYKCKPSVGFASRTLRSMDNRRGMIANKVIKNKSMKSMETTSRGQTEANTNIGDDSDSEWEYVDDCTPGPGHYDSQSVVSAIKPQAKLEKFQFFGSSSDRFKEEKRISQMGPQDYHPSNVNQIGRATHPFKVRNPPFLSSNTRFEMRSIEESKPGPGQYEPKLTLEEKLITKIQKGYRGSFGVTERRFKNASLVDDQPGPGSYLEVIPEQGEKDDNQKTAVFKSKAKRQIFSDPKEAKPPVGAYDLSYFNIESKVKKDDEDDEDLRIEKPGFGSELRFEWQKNEKKLELQRKLGEIPEDEESVTYSKDRNITDLFKKKPKQGAPFGAKGDRFMYKQKDKKPDPGQYYDPSVNNWDKRTYNIHFVKI